VRDSTGAFSPLMHWPAAATHSVAATKIAVICLPIMLEFYAGKGFNCCKQAITRFDRWSMSAMAMQRQLTRP